MDSTVQNMVDKRMYILKPIIESLSLEKQDAIKGQLQELAKDVDYYIRKDLERKINEFIDK